MLAIPRIDLRGGFSVRPIGPQANTTEAIGDALAIARTWGLAGFHRIHVVDADAMMGHGSNAMLVDDIIRDGAVDVETCDAAQSSDRIEQLVSAGAVRVVVGARALEEPEWLAGAAELYPGLLVVATSVRERRIAMRGWVRSLPLDVLDVVHELSGLPLGGLLVSHGTGEGSRTNMDLAVLEDVAEAADFPVIAAGGANTMSDLRALEHRGIAAVLLGDQLYNGELDPRSVAMEFGE